MNYLSNPTPFAERTLKLWNHIRRANIILWFYHYFLTEYLQVLKSDNTIFLQKYYNDNTTKYLWNNNYINKVYISGIIYNEYLIQMLLTI